MKLILKKNAFGDVDLLDIKKISEEMNVSRPAVYAWLKGKPVSKKNVMSILMVYGKTKSEMFDVVRD